jgi:hypothetical protein
MSSEIDVGIAPLAQVGEWCIMVDLWDPCPEVCGMLSCHSVDGQLISTMVTSAGDAGDGWWTTVMV